jgi:hypothetical protein
VALSTQFSDSPLLATTGELRMIDDPAGNCGSAFCTRKKMLFTSNQERGVVLLRSELTADGPLRMILPARKTA